MKFLLYTLSCSYVRRHLLKTFLTLLGVIVGVATFSAIRSAQETLVQGIRSTVDRVAGKAHLQITLAGGVPEEVLEKIRPLHGIRAVSPVIEQIVTPEKTELGSLMVLGIDLLGDREMRDYGFEGDDADLDDPLLFLAQPDSALFTRNFGDRARLTTGSSVTIRIPTGTKRVVARGMMSPKGFAEAFGGNLMVMDVYAAQQMFGRGRHFDRIDVRLAEGVTQREGIVTLERALGSAYRVETPDRRGQQMEQTVNNFVVGFNISSGFALCIGAFLIFNAFNVAVNRRRIDIGTLRALGATPRQIQSLFLAEALVIGMVGSLLGCLAGTAISQGFLQLMGQTTDTVYGIASSAGVVRLTPAIAMHSLLLGVCSSLAGAWSPALNASRITATEAFAKGAFHARTHGNTRQKLLIGGVALGCAVFLAAHPPYGGNPLILTVLGLGGVGLLLTLGPISRLLLQSLAPVIHRVWPVTGRLASDSLIGAPRRTSGTVMAMALSLTFVLGFGGYMESMKGSMVQWMEDSLTCDLFVRASANFARPDFLFPGDLRTQLLQVPGVRAVESYRAIRPLYKGQHILLGSIEIEPLCDRVTYRFFQGDETAVRHKVGRQGQCMVSENFYRRFGIGVGRMVELDSPSGTVRLPVAAVVRDYSSDQGTVFIDRSTFLKHWADDRVDIYDVSVLPGVDSNQVRTAIHSRLSGKLPALVTTRKEFVAEIGRAIDSFYALTRATVFLALVVAFLGIVTALFISVAERSREIGMLKALGAVPSQIGRSIVVEALLLALTGFVIALPAGNLFAAFMEGAVAEQFTGWSMPHQYPWSVMVQLVVALLPVSALAAWIPARQAAGIRITEALEYE